MNSQLDHKKYKLENTTPERERISMKALAKVKYSDIKNTSMAAITWGIDYPYPSIREKLWSLLVKNS